VLWMLLQGIVQLDYSYLGFTLSGVTNDMPNLCKSFGCLSDDDYFHKNSLVRKIHIYLSS
jgi:hypothetical protein